MKIKQSQLGTQLNQFCHCKDRLPAAMEHAPVAGKSLAGSPAVSCRICWLSGEEDWWLTEAQITVETWLMAHGFSLERYQQSNGVRLQEIVAESSLLGEQRAIIYHDRNSQVRQRASLIRQLSELLQQRQAAQPMFLGDQDFLLLITDKLESKERKSPAYLALEQHPGILIGSIWPLTGQELSVWLQQRLTQAQLQLVPAAQRYLLANYCNDPATLAQLIEKLRLYPPHRWQLAEVQRFLTGLTTTVTSFDLIKGILSDRPSAILTTLDILQSARWEPIGILATLLKELRLLIVLHRQLAATVATANRSTTMQALARQFNLWFEHRELIFAYWQALQQIPGRALTALLLGGYQLDRLIKGAAEGETGPIFWCRLREWCLEIARVLHQYRK